MNETAAMQELWTGASCQAADKDCRGRLEWHHAVKQQRLRREFKYGAYRNTEDTRWYAASRLNEVRVTIGEGRWARALDDILGDPRNRVWLCSHHHELVTNGRLEVPLPQSVWEFADEFGLRGMLENDIARRAA